MGKNKKASLNMDILKMEIPQGLEPWALDQEQSEPIKEEQPTAEKQNKKASAAKKRKQTPHYKPTLEEVNETPLLLEPKNETILLKVYPTLKKKLKEEAKKQGMSVNNYINACIIQDLKNKGIL